MTHTEQISLSGYALLQSKTQYCFIIKRARVAEGDKIIMQEFDNAKKEYTGREKIYSIESATGCEESMALKTGWTVIGVKEVNEWE